MIPGSESIPSSAANDGIAGFSQRVLRYFLTFLQTDFKRQQAPRRRIQLKSESGFRTGIPLRKYLTLNNTIWKFAASAPNNGLTFRLPPGKYVAPMSEALRDLIRQHTAAIHPDIVRNIATACVEYAKARRGKALDNPESFVDSVQLHFVELTGKGLIQSLLALLEGPFTAKAYSAIESIYDVESDLTEAVTTRVVEALPPAINSLIVKGDTEPMKAIFDEFFTVEDIRGRVQAFFDDFSTADAFLEARDLQHTLRSAEQQSFYLSLCEIRFGSQAFPLFYIPATFEYDDTKREFSFEFDPHLYINKQAIDWILQERRGESTTLPISPVQDRIIYLDGGRSFVDEMETVLNRLIPSLELAAGINLRQSTLQQQSSPTLKIANTAYFAIFDKSDEALLNDYEEMLAAFAEESSGARSMFENIIRGFLIDNPISVQSEVNGEWKALSISERLVAIAPIPVNEEQRKILSAIKNPDCNYISVEGPPGTGKSHTITAIAFDCILNGKNVLVLSDKTEALDVVQDKLETTLQKVRQGDEDFPNPILRLGRSGSTYNRLISASSREKIRTHFDAAKAHEVEIEAEATAGRTKLKADLDQTIKVFSGIRLAEIEALHRLEGELEALFPGAAKWLQHPSNPALVPTLADTANRLAATTFPPVILSQLRADGETGTLKGLRRRLAAWMIAAELAPSLRNPKALKLFTVLEAQHQPILMQYLMAYENLRMPLFGFLFRKGRVQALNMQVGAALPCPDPVDLHRHIPDLKIALGMVGQICALANQTDLTEEVGFIYRLLRSGEANLRGVAEYFNLIDGFTKAVFPPPPNVRPDYGTANIKGIESLLHFVVLACQYAHAWQQVTTSFASLPTMDYVGTKSRLEQLHTARMTREIDERFLNFVTNKSATAKSIGGVIKAKQKFPEEEFHHLSDAFPCIIAGIRDYAEYVPLKQRLFEVVIIDEGSQVSVAQALPALLRAKKVIVFGDQKQFSNVKSSQASNAINAGHLTDIEAYFRANVSDAATKLQRLKHFDVKRSILEFFALISNYQTMLHKHFRGYQELISFSSKKFYGNALQAIKIRSIPIDEVIRFDVITDGANDGKSRNTNSAEAKHILETLRRMIDENEDLTVGVITPFREQVKVLNDTLFRDAYGERFNSELRLKVMTFDTCQGEERDLIIYSMVATPTHDSLNYVFPVELKDAEERIEDALKYQRLNVGFSRAKEGILFVLSKPVEAFHGSIGEALMHYKTVLETKILPSAEDTDQSSPMESKVLDWISKTQFYQNLQERIEVIAQFPIGEYLKQLDPFYKHPAYRCDFLLKLHDHRNPLNVVIEYDGFAEHFTNLGQIHSGNWEHYYKPEDIERQMVIESYGYRFLRLNRFNLGKDPITVLSSRLYELAKTASMEDLDSVAVGQIKEDADSITNGTKKVCPKCGEIRSLMDFYDKKLRNGIGGFGRSCMACKAATTKSSTPGTGRKRSRYRKPRWSKVYP